MNLSLPKYIPNIV